MIKWVISVRYIEKIFGAVENTNHNVDIHIKGQNLIVVGGNGSGKTSFLRSVFARIKNNIVEEQFLNLKQFSANVKIYQEALVNADEAQAIQYKEELAKNENYIAVIKGRLSVDYNDPAAFIDLKRRKLAVVKLFEADRKAAIQDVKFASGSLVSFGEVDVDASLGNNLEQHLVNLHVRTALGAQKTGNDTRLEEINKWFSSFEKNLKYLFEDESTHLNFDPDRFKFTIRQEGKPEYNFQNLSSGYLSVFDIYADLLMRSEYLQVIPEELFGAVLIDELDAHLHVSLQRKIFPFLSRSFPNIQFIVTTHSPFVLTSVDNALIFDLTTNQESHDLSMYSFEAVVEGLLGVPPISKKLEETIKSLAEATDGDGFDVAEAESILKKITPYIDSLDDESLMFYQMAVNKIIKMRAGEA